MPKVGIWWDLLPLGCRLPMPETDTQDLCPVAAEKQIREEQTWRLQKTLQDLVSRFQDWLRSAEATAAASESSPVSYASSKKELQKLEALQRQVSDKLPTLEALNRQYHQLVRKGSLCPQLKSRVQEVNRRWDALKTLATAVHQKLKHFVAQWEEFESEQETLRLWLMELDLRLTDVEHFSGGTSLEKMTQLQTFQEDVQANAERVDRLLAHGERLIQKSHPEDAEILMEELEELSCFCQEVFRRVFRFQRRLVSMRLVFEDEWLSDRDSDLESDGFSEDSLKLDKGGDGHPLDPLGQSTPRKALLHHKGTAPNEGGTVDLEWDPSVDVGGSTSHDEEDSSYYSAITGIGCSEEPRPRFRASRWVSSPLPWKCARREDSTVQSRCGEECEHLDGSVAKQKQKIGSLGKSLSWEELLGCPEEKSCFHASESLGFDPQRVESWLGQNCQEERRMQDETSEDGAGISPPFPLPATGKYPAKPTATGHRAKQQKPPQRTKKKTRPTLVPSPGLMGDAQISKERRLSFQPAEIATATEKGFDPANISARSQELRTFPPAWKRRLGFFLLALLLLFLLLAGPSSRSFFVFSAKPSCLRANTYARSSHLTLKHHGPPPT